MTTTTIAPGVDSLTPTLVGGSFQFLTLVDPQFEAGDVTIDGENIANLPTVNAAGDILLDLTDAENVAGAVVQFRDQTVPQAWGDLDYHIVGSEVGQASMLAAIAEVKEEVEKIERSAEAVTAGGIVAKRLYESDGTTVATNADGSPAEILEQTV